jgi:hypothetical protein
MADKRVTIITVAPPFVQKGPGQAPVIAQPKPNMSPPMTFIEGFVVEFNFRHRWS